MFTPSKYGNFNLGTVKSVFNCEGYFDGYNFDASSLSTSANFLTFRKSCAIKTGKINRWEFSFTPTSGFLGNPEPLQKSCELKLSFNRAPPENSVLRIAGESNDFG